MAEYCIENYFLADYLLSDYFFSSDAIISTKDTLSERALASVFPTGELAWSGMSNGEQRKFSNGLAKQIERARLLSRKIISDFFPGTTELFEEWENTYRLPSGKYLSDKQRRSRLSAAWSRKSAATYDGIAEIFQLSGFDVKIRPVAPGEDPRDYPIDEPDTTYIYADGRPGQTIKNYICVCGVMRTGQISESSRVGAFRGSRVLPVDITVPDETWAWPLIFIIEGDNGETANVSSRLKAAFEFMVYKAKPLFMWAIARVEYDYWEEISVSEIPTEFYGPRPKITTLSNTEVAITFDFPSTCYLLSYKLTGEEWIPSGDPLSIPYATFNFVISLTPARVVVFNLTEKTLTAYDKTPVGWAQVGNAYSLSIGTATVGELAKLTVSTFAFLETDENLLVAFSFDGLNFAQIGNITALPGEFSNSGFCAISADTVVVYACRYLYQLLTYSFDGSDWISVSSPIDAVRCDYPSMVALSSSRFAFFSFMAFYDRYVAGIRAYDAGPYWTLSGGMHIQKGAGSYTELTPISADCILLCDSIARELRMFKYVGEETTGDVPPALDF